MVAGARAAPASRVAVVSHAEAAPSPAPSSSVALVKVTEDSKLTTASLLGGAAGLWLGGLWVGLGAFAAASYLSRSDKDSDVSKALTSVSGAGLDAVNFAAGLEAKYEVTGKLSGAINDTIESAKSKPEQKEAAEAVSGFFSTAGDVLNSIDEEVQLKSTLGNIANFASEIAFTATTTIADLNDKYKVTDQVKEKINELTKKSSESP